MKKNIRSTSSQNRAEVPGYRKAPAPAAHYPHLVKMTEKITKKAQTSETAARAVCLRPYKTSEISNRLAGLRANEQYHQMCG
jgi:hypothetical protein